MVRGTAPAAPCWDAPRPPALSAATLQPAVAAGGSKPKPKAKEVNCGMLRGEKGYQLLEQMGTKGGPQAPTAGGGAEAAAMAAAGGVGVEAVAAAAAGGSMEAGVGAGSGGEAAHGAHIGQPTAGGPGPGRRRRLGAVGGHAHRRGRRLQLHGAADGASGVAGEPAGCLEGCRE